MKQTKKIISVLLLSLMALTGLQAKEKKEKKVYTEPPKFWLMQNWGLAWQQITRIQVNTDRSNFVWRDDLVGLYYELETACLPINFICKLDVFYPLTQTFNFVPQAPKQVLRYAFNLNAGPVWKIPLWTITTVDLSPVIGFRYQMDDNFNHFDLGLGGLAKFEFPLTEHFTILLNTGFTYDLGNLGSNNNVRNYNHVWNFNAALGFRICNRISNDFYYIKPKGI